VSVCVAYKLDGKELDEPPTDPEDLARAEPVFQRFPGWEALPADARSIEALPASARSYVQTISQMAGVPFCLVSVGPDRSETIRLTDPFAN
jgi:adenylosuccinate synthase